MTSVGERFFFHQKQGFALRVENRVQQVGNGGAMLNRLVDESGSLKLEWLTLSEKFSDRITIGSDEFFFPVESTRQNQSFAETWSLLYRLPPERVHKLDNENPRRIYNLK